MTYRAPVVPPTDPAAEAAAEHLALIRSARRGLWLCHALAVACILRVVFAFVAPHTGAPARRSAAAREGPGAAEPRASAWSSTPFR